MHHHPILTISHLSVDVPNRRLFEDLSLSLTAGDVVAVIGNNGCGKSTLLRLIEELWRGHDSRTVEADCEVEGSIHVASSISLVHVPQRSDSATPPLSDTYGALSDGERQRALLSAAFAAEAEFYLFDEPTNHLDIDGIVWFESEVLALKGRGAGMLLVSHDRQLINNLADRTVYLTPNGVYTTRGGYASAQSVARSDYDAKRHQAATINSKIKKLESEARTRMNWAGQKEKSKRGAGSAKPHIAKMAAKMAARAKAARAKAAKEIERLKQTKPFVPKPVQLRLPAYEVRHRSVCSLEEVGYSYATGSPTKPVLQGVTLGLATTDRVCVLGANGAGKSTLLNLMAGEYQPTEGTIRRNEGVKVSYLPQGLTGFFGGRTLLEGLAGVSADEATVRTLLGGVMIRGDKVHQSLASLSPGELTRAALVKAMVDRADFLLLDEPTSHLDIESVEVLEETLRQFPGGYLIISHDRSFVGAVADSLYILAGGRLKLA